jgi:8-oxo-dGTP pyrophosphatase MutT (NUDIX family)
MIFQAGAPGCRRAPLSLQMGPTRRSAGLILFHDETGIRSYLLLRHAPGAHWSFPKGGIEAGETLESAARRELKEETGIAQIELLEGFREVERYSFAEGGETVHKAVVYFLARTPERVVTLSPEHSEYRWLPFEPALAQLTYENSRELLRRAEAFLRGAT